MRKLKTLKAFGLALLAVGLLTLLAALGVLFSDGERVTLTDSGGSVSVYDGIFHESVYRYVNPLVHGELLYEWQD